MPACVPQQIISALLSGWQAGSNERGAAHDNSNKLALVSPAERLIIQMRFCYYYYFNNNLLGGVCVCDFCSLLHVVAGETTKEPARAAQTENASRAVLTWIVCGAAAGNGKMVCGLVAKSSPPVENTRLMLAALLNQYFGQAVQ
jgi:hypothetical protein